MIEMMDEDLIIDFEDELRGDETFKGTEDHVCLFVYCLAIPEPGLQGSFLVCAALVYPLVDILAHPSAQGTSYIYSSL